MMCKQTDCIKWWVAVIVGFLSDTARPCPTSAEGAMFFQGFRGSPPENFEKSKQNGGNWRCLWHYFWSHVYAAAYLRTGSYATDKTSYAILNRSPDFPDFCFNRICVDDCTRPATLTLPIPTWSTFYLAGIQHQYLLMSDLAGSPPRVPACYPGCWGHHTSGHLLSRHLDTRPICWERHIRGVPCRNTAQ